LVELGGCISIKNQEAFTAHLLNLKDDEDFRKRTGKINKKYIEDNLGATAFIMKYLKEML
jgi:3-deoxy-D-manno-octulosonic-acid transferase